MVSYQSCETIRNITVTRGALQLIVRAVFRVRLELITQTKVANVILVFEFIDWFSFIY
jgi:hypothetical protein